MLKSAKRRRKGPGLVTDLRLSRARQALLDTNAFIYYLSGEQPYLQVLQPLFRRIQEGSLSVIVSAITEAELLVRPERDDNAVAKERVADLLSEHGIYVLPVDRRIARRAAAIRGRHRMALADAIIVATAVETDCDVIVGNDGEWSRKLTDLPIVRLDDLVRDAGGAPAGEAVAREES
jgi:predicted nucleic acid-binding protein